MIAEGRLGDEDRFSLHLLRICLQYMRKRLTLLAGM